MKEVIAVYNENMEFKQFLKKSEVRLLVQMMKDAKNKLQIKLTEIPVKRYNLEFGV